MSAPDRSWTIAPTLLWFCACLVGGLLVVDGSVQAIADRVTTRREAAPASTTFAPTPTMVADARDDEKAPPLPIPDTGDRGRVGALEDVCLEGTAARCKRWGMDGFYRAIAASKARKLGRAVRVSWYGDSVVATDAIPSRLRERLQGELGDGGPGFVYVVPPHRFCHHEGVTRTQIGEWRTHAISTQPTLDGMYGVGGASADTFSGSATIKLRTGTATNVELYFVAQPRGGTATIKANGKEVLSVSTAADEKAAGHASATSDPAKKIELVAKGKVRVYGVGIENATGAVVDNLGIVSVNARNFAARDINDFTSQLARRSADLVLVMMGANEAQWLQTHDKAVDDYRARFEKAIAPLRKGRPDGSCLVVSPLDQAEAKDGGYPSRPVMPLIVDAQRKAAHAVGCAFFSTYDWMGGKGSAAKWYKRNLIGSDFQHLVKKGANKMADGLFDALLAGHARYAKL